MLVNGVVFGDAYNNKHFEDCIENNYSLLKICGAGKKSYLI